MSTFTILPDDRQPEPKVCVGQIFRCLRNGFVSAQDGTYNFQIKFRPLKGLSCPGCSRCDFDYGDDIYTMFDLFVTSSGSCVMTDAQPGGIYKLAITNVSTDWETGYVDDYDLSFIKVNREVVKKGNRLSWKTEEFS